ncbi:MAG: squalene/phytoene synthase family protein [Solirubrobacterales bacterium]|nr:squalene/phytoene synthase family protein [Solirubrobacterales bacterium]
MLVATRLLGPALLVRGLTADRNRPDLDSLARETDPERFVWRVLPHAARSFAASIVVLPREKALAAAVAYLYCRMLDSYEDLIDGPGECEAGIEKFAARFNGSPLTVPEPIPATAARDDRDRVYLLLIERCNLVDSVYATLPDLVQDQIAELVRSMAEGMVWSTRTFSDQGGVLEDQEQLARYCRNVIGHPALFTLSQVADAELTNGAREDALLVSEMIQLANVSRDIERDLERGISYHPALRPWLGQPMGADARVAVSRVREIYMSMALSRASAYRRLFEGLNLGGTAAVRTAAVLMLSFTDLHYRGCATRTGHTAWPGPASRLQVVARTLPSVVSRGWAGNTIRQIENDFLHARLGLNA